MSVLNINKNNFEEIVNGEKPVLLDFYADCCGPCRMVAPTVHSIAEEHPEYVVGKINVDTSPELAREFGIYSIPTLIVMKGGELHKRAEGARPKEAILEMFN